MTHPYDDLQAQNVRGSHSIKWSLYPEDVIPLWVADMDYPISSAIVDALEARMTRSVGYPQMTGDPELVRAITKHMTRWGFQLEKAHIWPMSGVVPGLFSAVKAFSQGGAPVLTQVPIYPPFLMAIREQNRTVLENPLLEDGYKIDFEALERSITPETRLMLFCNPHNPSGRVWKRDELERLAQFVIRHDLILVSDDLHAELDFTGDYLPIASLSAEISSRTITLIGPCKAYNTAGLGAGAAVSSNVELLERMKVAGHGFVSFPTVLSQAAWVAAYDGAQGWLEDTVAYLKGNRDFLSEFLARELPQIGYFAPEGTYLAWLDFRALLGNGAQAWLLEHAKVGLNDGAAYGEAYAGFVRLNFATSRTLLTEALERIARAVSARVRESVSAD